ncbi:Rha family transcriptional regulator [Fructilactobacillus sanfranciscensis]|uniref:Rha family transcriptional regulator n=1 Tax=Fructilactobacillus sanfranciscensis TaxID=1625 RepID=UPI0013D7B18B|nr:phage regulatory protein/antirepressor Ant [Fructilactobacillus sanfranciscensis]NDR97392.1 phage regulatory protein/antirepressor Ant [Fructilactobacillus sanfranciscensis]
MNKLVVMKDQQAVTSSLQVAETFGKRHKNVIRSIENMTAQNSALQNMFKLGTYLSKQNKTLPMYYMNRDGFTLLVVGFTGKKAMDFKLKYIEAFNAMENQIRNYGGFQIPNNMSEALQLAANQAKEMEEMRPKALFAEAVQTSKTDILVGQLAKILKQNGIDIGANRLFKWLRENGYLIKQQGMNFNTPTQKAMDFKLFRIKENTIVHSDGHTTINKTPKVTGIGQVFFVNKFLRNRNQQIEG